MGELHMYVSTYSLFVQYTYRIRSIVKLYPCNYIVMHVLGGGGGTLGKEYVHFIIVCKE